MDYVVLVIVGLAGMIFGFAARFIWVYGANTVVRAIFVPLFLFAALVGGFIISLGEYKNRPGMGETWMEMPFADLLRALAPLGIQAWLVELGLAFLLFWAISKISPSVPNQT